MGKQKAPLVTEWQKKIQDQIEADSLRVWEFISTVGGIGYFPYAPGTLASLAGVILSFSLRKNPVLGAMIFIFLFLAGLIASGKIERREKKRDPSHVVIDEFSSTLVVFFLLPMDIVTVPTGLILYRFFDILKPAPISFAEKIEGGWGIMLDDLLSGVFANLLLRSLLCFL